MTFRLAFLALAVLLPGAAQATTVTIDVRGPDGAPLADAVVMVDVAGARVVQHGPYVMEQKAIAFQPHVLVVPVGATVSFPNRDPFRHHVYSFSKAKKFDLKLYGRDETRSVVFDQAGTVALGCNIHDSMSGFIIVSATPYAARTDRAGRAIFADVPAGAVRVRIWAPAIHAPRQYPGAGDHGSADGSGDQHRGPSLMRSIRLPRFGRLRTKLAVLYTGLFAVALTLLGVTAQALIRTHAQASTKAELVASGTVYDGLWALRSKTLGDTAAVLAHDFGFRTAVATGDRATIDSALATLRDRAGVQMMMVVNMDGRVIGAPPVLAGLVAGVATDLQPGRHDAVVVAGDAVYRVVVSPIMAPTRIGSVVFALPLDAAEMRSLQDLSAIPLTATMLHRDAAGHWVSADRSVVADAAVDALVASSHGHRSLAMLDLPSGRAFALAQAADRARRRRPGRLAPSLSAQRRARAVSAAADRAGPCRADGHPARRACFDPFGTRHRQPDRRAGCRGARAGGGRAYRSRGRWP